MQRNPTIVMLAFGFLLLIGTTLIAEGFGAHVLKGYIYAAIAFSTFVEGANILRRRAQQRTAGESNNQTRSVMVEALRHLHDRNSPGMLV